MNAQTVDDELRREVRPLQERAREIEEALRPRRELASLRGVEDPDDDPDQQGH